MKKAIKYFSLLCAMMLVSVAFTACDDDDTLTSDAEKVVGTYVGEGSLVKISNSEVFDQYPNMQLILKYRTDNSVYVIPYTEPGESLFENEGAIIYFVRKDGNKGYYLTPSDGNEGHFTISKDGVVSMEYPYIMSKQYALTFEGAKQKK